MQVSSNASFFSMASSIFFVLNATGQVPLFLAMLARFDQKRQLKIIVRELFIALAILLLFTFAGDTILQILGITQPIIAIAGGTLLFLISLGMIFPKASDSEKAVTKEPLIIPLAMPIIAGPGAMTTVMVFAHETGAPLLVAGAALAAWIPSLLILLAGSLVKQILGEKGMVAVERLGGMIVCLIGIQMLTSGILVLVKEYFTL